MFNSKSVSFLVFLLARLVITQSTCRCMPGDACWPTAAVWNDFNKTIGGNLIATIPIGSFCHLDVFEAFNETSCTDLQTAWNDPNTHVQSSSSIMAPFFSNYSCDPFAAKNASCVIGTYVQYAVNASDASHYVETLSFVNKHNLRLVVRNSGHDYFGKSTGAGAVSIWTHHLKDIVFLDYETSYYTGKAVKVGAGVDVIEGLTAAHAQGLVLAAGNEDTVGYAGGYSQGGGHGPLVSKFGLAADQVLEWEVVTAQGELLVATPINNTDLYWALSGGGGGTYGVVLSMTSRAHPDNYTGAANLTFVNTGSQSAYWEVVETFVNTMPALVDIGAVSIWLATNETFSMSPTSGLGVTKAQLDSIFNITISKLEENQMDYSYFSADFPTFLDFFSGMNPTTPVNNIQIGGRFIPRSLIESSNGSNALVAVMQDISNKGVAISGIAMDAAQRNGDVSNSVHPEWRTAILDMVVGTFWSNTDHELNIANQNLITGYVMPQLEQLTPGGGAYLNEGDFRQPDWQQVFYGPNYDALKRIKDKYDPEQLFYALTAVGSDRWTTTEDGRLCKV